MAARFVWSGEIVTAIAMTEPSRGSNLAALKTTAIRDEKGRLFNGSTTLITDGASSSAEGFRRGREHDEVGQPETDTAELFFDDPQLDEGALLGKADRGFGYMMERLPQERIRAAVSDQAHVRPLLDETLAYCTERCASGTRSRRPLSTNASSITPRARLAQSRRPRRHGGAPTSGTRSSTPACSSVAATAT